MVMSWLFNSMLLELLDVFLYVILVEELWKEVNERFG